MDAALSSYLAAHPWHYETIERWPVQGELRLRLSRAAQLPPPSVTSSILAIVMNARSQVLYLWPAQSSGSIAQILIGGRPKLAETPAATVIREVGEETGWRVTPGAMIGFRHFFHLESRSEQSDRPYPDFVQPIYVASAVAFDRKLLVAEDQIDSAFIDFATAEQSIEPAQRPLLHAAVAALAKRG